MRRPIRRALVSVYDKTGLEDLAHGLHANGVEIVSTGSTADHVEAAGVPVTRVESVTGFPECLDGRVKTLHPAVHAGLLADQRDDGHVAQLRDLGIAAFELLVSNLYPFADAVASGASPEECIAKIDIGGPAMVRGAAKNHGSVAVVVDPDRYAELLASVEEGGFTDEQRRRLAAEAFAHVASYDASVANWMTGSLTPTDEGTGFPYWLGTTWNRTAVLRYGENPHQRAALYTNRTSGLAHARQLHGKELSYNNYVDADAARRAVYEHDEPAVAVIKHTNPCGIAVGSDVADAHRKAHACDPVSAYGGVIAVNRPVTAELAAQIAEIFTEVVVAPAYEDGTLDVLRGRKNVRLLRCEPDGHDQTVEYTPVSGGLLAQTVDRLDAEGDHPANWKLVTGEPVDEKTLADLVFAWRTLRAVKSNAIVLAADRATVGIGMGQVNRVDSARLAVSRAGERVRGSVAASDAYFPFADGLEVLLEAGVRAVVQPGGSIRDEEVVAAARAAGVPLYLTGTRHFFH